MQGSPEPLDKGDVPVVEPPPSKIREQVRLRGEVLAQRGQGLLSASDARTHGAVGVILAAVQSFAAARAVTAAAAVTFYALLSLFPLLMLIVSLAGLIFGSDRVLQQISAAFATFVPVSQDLLQQTLTHSAGSSGSARLVAVVVLLWGATGFLAELQAHIGLAWRTLGGRASTLRERSLAALIVLLLLLALILLMTINYLVAPVALLEHRPLLSALARGFLTPLAQGLIVWIVAGCLVFVAYLQIPGVRVWRRAALCAALLVSLAWQLAALVFGWWVGSGLANFEFFYGSLSAVVALLIWMNVSAMIILAGAHLAAAIQGRWAPTQPGDDARRPDAQTGLL